MNVDNEIKQLMDECAVRQERIKWLMKHRDKLADAPKISWYGNQVDFDHLTHKEVVKVVRKFGGKWNKTATAVAGKINYQTEIEGTIVRCYEAEAPPSCKLIEVEEHVPEKIIPAHTVKKLVMKCHPDVGAVIATAAAKAPQAGEVTL